MSGQSLEREPIGVVLAGGRGRRMGRRKAEIEIAGRTLAERAAATLAVVCRGVLVSGAAGWRNPAPGYPYVEDDPPAGRGPLAGLAAGFRAAAGRDLLVLACDYPAVSPGLLARALELASAAPRPALVILRDPAGRDHPLVGLWRTAAEEAVRRAVAAGSHAVRGVVEELCVRRVGPEDCPGLDLSRLLLNVNAPDDLRDLVE